MATIRLHPDDLTTIAQTIINGIDAGPSAGTLDVYAGTMPASPAVALTDQVLLGSLTLSDPCASYANKVITFGTIAQDAAANASGTAAFAILRTSAGAARVILDCGNNASTAAVKFNTVSIVEGGPIQVSSLTITLGG